MGKHGIDFAACGIQFMTLKQDGDCTESQISSPARISQQRVSIHITKASVSANVAYTELHILQSPKEQFS